MSYDILLVDDSVDLRIPMKRMLELEGYSVRCAENGQVALETLRAGDALPRLILLDLMMPVMDGPTFRTEQLRSPGLATIPVIILSASSKALRDAESLKAYASLPKPIDVDALLQLAEPLLRPKTS